jgi:hypothetical protein
LLVRGRRRDLPFRAALRALRARLGFWAVVGVVVWVAAVASGHPLVGAALLAPFGLTRGLGPGLAFGVRSPSDGAAWVDRLGDRGRAPLAPCNGVALVAVLVATLTIRTVDGRRTSARSQARWR